MGRAEAEEGQAPDDGGHTAMLEGCTIDRRLLFLLSHQLSFLQEWLWAPYVHCKFLQPLTDRWREVPASVAHRMTNDDIAEEMVVSPATVRPASCDRRNV